MAALDREEFAQARHTLASGERDRQEEEYDWASCKAHQAAEYALKGLLRGLGRPTFGHALLRLIQALREAGVEAQVFLYGSVARGNFNGESDIDLLVVSPNLPKEPLERLALLQGMNAGWVEARGLTPEEFSRLKVKGALWWLEGAIEL